jgi:hypothetical protein
MERFEEVETALVIGEALVGFRVRSERQAGGFTFALLNCLFCYGIAMTRQ